MKIENFEIHLQLLSGLKFQEDYHHARLIIENIPIIFAFFCQRFWPVCLVFFIAVFHTLMNKCVLRYFPLEFSQLFIKPARLLTV